jgi:hypothetical protein
VARSRVIRLAKFFAHWVIVSFEKVFIMKKWPTFWATFSCIDFDKNGLGYILGDFLQTPLVTLARRRGAEFFLRCPQKNLNYPCRDFVPSL